MLPELHADRVGLDDPVIAWLTAPARRPRYSPHSATTFRMEEFELCLLGRAISIVVLDFSHFPFRNV
jgi:hypothetical protein